MENIKVFITIQHIKKKTITLLAILLTIKSLLCRSVEIPETQNFYNYY